MNVYGSVYGLHDPLTDELRYIGQTTSNLAHRLSGHLSLQNRQKSYRSARWVQSLVAKGPMIRLRVEASSQEELDRLEVEQIKTALEAGVRLTNCTVGGQGVKGWKHTEAWKEHMRQVMAGRCTNHPKHYERLADMKRGVSISEETKAKISAAKKGKPSSKRGPMSEEQKVKVSASRKGKLLGATHHQYRGDISTDFILQRIAEGWTKVQVAEELGVSSTFIHRRLNQAGLTGEIRPKGKREAWNKGKAHSAEHVANFAASRRGKATGTDHHFYRHDILDEDLRQKVQEGLTPSQIAQYYGVARITVARRLRKVA